MTPNGTTLRRMAIEYIDLKCAALEAQREDLARQIEWLRAQRQELFDEDAGARLKARYPEA